MVPTLVLIGWGLVPLFVTLFTAEMVLLAVVPQLPPFRRYVDAKLDAIERARAAEMRASLLVQMTNAHRAELERLELLADRIRERATPPGTEIEQSIDDYLGLARLLAGYVRLAIAYRNGRETLAMTNRQALADEIRQLSAAREAPNGRNRALTEKRLAVSQMRADRWDRTYEELEAITEQLAMIGDLIRLTHDHCTAPVDARSVTVEIDRAFASLRDNEKTLRELSELLADNAPLEPHLLALGRTRVAVQMPPVRVLSSPSPSVHSVLANRDPQRGSNHDGEREASAEGRCVALRSA
jgi:hypothetical protein